jgi:hypothetical protein
MPRSGLLSARGNCSKWYHGHPTAVEGTRSIAAERLPLLERPWCWRTTLLPAERLALAEGPGVGGWKV